MDNAEYTDRIICALRKVPPKQLKIIELVHRLTVDGEIDTVALAEAQPEVNLAVAEAKSYTVWTGRAVARLEEIKDVRPGPAPANE